MQVNFAEVVDLGGASCAAMVWRAAAAIELGLCNVVVIAAPSWPSPRPPVSTGGASSWRYGASSANYGSPQAEFDIPYGNVAQNCGYAQIAMKYGAEYGYDAEALAKIAVDPAGLGQSQSCRRLPSRPDHGRRRAQFAGDFRSDSHARDCDAVRRWGGDCRRRRRMSHDARSIVRPGLPDSASASCIRRRRMPKTCSRLR